MPLLKLQFRESSFAIRKVRTPASSYWMAALRRFLFPLRALRCTHKPPPNRDPAYSTPLWADRIVEREFRPNIPNTSRLLATTTHLMVG
jgi:hypothetical protein